MKLDRYFVAFAILATPVAAVGQSQPAPSRAEAVQPRADRGDGIARLLQRQEDLGLTADQVSRLEAIRAEVLQQNQPLMARLEEVGTRRGDRSGPPTPEERETMRQRRAELEPFMQQIRQNSQAAMERAQAVLTADQRELASQIIADRDDRGREPNRRPNLDRERGRG